MDRRVRGLDGSGGREGVGRAAVVRGRRGRRPPSTPSSRERQNPKTGPMVGANTTPNVGTMNMTLNSAAIPKLLVSP